MIDDLAGVIAGELARPVLPEIGEVAEVLASDHDVAAVLFYGSILRTGDLDGVLDYYVLTDRARSRAGRWLWPDVGFHEVEVDGRLLRAKVATMPLDTFAAAAAGERLDTTIWARFVQPAALVWSRDAESARRTIDAVAAAAMSAARFAAVLGPPSGLALDYWRALFRETYRAEFRVEKPGREASILAHDPDRYARLLPLAWAADGIGVEREGDRLTPELPPAARRATLARWWRRRRAGKPLNAARLVKASFTFAGAARYALWKIERHTGVALPLTRFRERHPVLAAPGVLWRVWRAQRTLKART